MKASLICALLFVLFFTVACCRPERVVDGTETQPLAKNNASEVNRNPLRSAFLVICISIADTPLMPTSRVPGPHMTTLIGLGKVK